MLGLALSLDECGKIAAKQIKRGIPTVDTDRRGLEIRALMRTLSGEISLELGERFIDKLREQNREREQAEQQAGQQETLL